MDSATPEAIAQRRRHGRAVSVAYTYNDPVIFAEYALTSPPPAVRSAYSTSPSLPGTSREPAPRVAAAMDAN